MRKLLSKSEAAALVGLHPVSLMRLVKQGQFPCAIKVSSTKNGRVRFDETDVVAWVNERKANSSAIGLASVEFMGTPNE